jgi:hypothetical protein
VVDRTLRCRFANEEETLLTVVFVRTSRLNQGSSIGAVVGLEGSLFTFWREFVACAQLVFENFEKVFFLVVGCGEFVLIFIVTTLATRALFLFGVVEIESLVIGWRFLRRRYLAISNVIIAVATLAIAKIVVIAVVEFFGVNLETIQTFEVVRVDTFGCWIVGRLVGCFVVVAHYRARTLADIPMKRANWGETTVTTPHGP